MQPGHLPGLSGLPLQSHDLRDPRRAAQSSQGTQLHGIAAQAAGQPGAMLYTPGVVVTSFAPQQPGMHIAFSQPGAVQGFHNQTLIHPYGGNLPMAQAPGLPQQQFVMPQLQQPSLQLQRFAPQMAPQPQQQQPLWTANLTSVGPVQAGHPVQLASHSLQQQQGQPAAPRPLVTAVAPGAKIPTESLGVTQPQPSLLQQQQQMQQLAQSQQQQQQQPPGALQSAARQAAGPPAAAAGAAGPPPPAAAPGPASMGPSSSGGAAAGGGSSAAAPRPMKRQAYQALQGNAAKRQHQQQRGLASNSVSYRAPYPLGDSVQEASGVPGGSAGARPAPGVVRMLADAQAYIVRIMLYMVKHNQFRPNHASGRVDKQGYDLCKLKADFLNEYKYELDTKAVG